MDSAFGRSTDFSPASARPAAYRGAFPEVWRWLCRAYLGAMGWKMQGDWPPYPKAVLCAAPHTSNWDGVNMLAAAGAYRAGIAWMGKASLTTGPFGPLVKWLGCVPIERSASHDMVKAMAEAFAARSRMLLLIPPEGTRGRTARWRSGFYFIAHEAKVPIVFTVLDYGTKTIRISGALVPSGDYEVDLPEIQRHYATAVGKHAENFDVAAAGPRQDGS